MNDVIEAALAVVNQARSKFGQETIARLPKGLRGNTTNCPLANCLPDDPMVGRAIVRFADEKAARALAKTLGREVIHDPDLTALPEDTKAWKSCIGPEKSKALSRPWLVQIGDTPLSDFVNRFDGDLDVLSPFKEFQAFDPINAVKV